MLRLLAVEKQGDWDYDFILNIAVPVEPSQSVSALTDMVKEAVKTSRPQLSDAVAITVYGLDPPLNYKEIRRIADAKRAIRNLEIGSNSFDERAFSISPLDLVANLEVEDGKVGLLFVFSHVVARQPLKRPADGYITRDIIQRWQTKRSKITLPSTPLELRTLMDTPLQENEKIPITQIRLEMLLSTVTNDPRDLLAPEEANILFRSSDTDDATLLATVFFSAAFTRPPASDGTTKESCHSFWDDNIRKVVQVLVPSGKSIRNGNEHSATRKLRPGFGYILDGRCPFRGEEKGPEDFEDPKDELLQKLDWDYGSVPYLLGYCCRGTRLTLMAILKPEQANDRPKLQDLATTDLNTRKGRIMNMRWLINLSPLLQDLVNLMPQREAEYVEMKRDNCTIELTARHVIKRYTCPDALQKIEHLRKIYRSLKEMQVSNTDAIHSIVDSTIILRPRGHRERPKTEKELLEAIFCILEVLKAIHPALFHRDIRWPNIIRRKDDPSQWFLIDWEDAQGPPTKALKNFASNSHSPRVFQDGHGADVDIWGVGHLITEAEAIGRSPELYEIGAWMKEESPSAEEAWIKLRHYASGTP